MTAILFSPRRDLPNHLCEKWEHIVNGFRVNNKDQMHAWTTACSMLYEPSNKRFKKENNPQCSVRVTSCTKKDLIFGDLRGTWTEFDMLQFVNALCLWVNNFVGTEGPFVVEAYIQKRV